MSRCRRRLGNPVLNRESFKVAVRETWMRAPVEERAATLLASEQLVAVGVENDSRDQFAGLFDRERDVVNRVGVSKVGSAVEGVDIPKRNSDGLSWPLPSSAIMPWSGKRALRELQLINFSDAPSASVTRSKSPFNSKRTWHVRNNSGAENRPDARSQSRFRDVPPSRITRPASIADYATSSMRITRPRKDT